MSIRNKGLVFAMESEEVVDAPVEEMVPETQAEVETASAEVTEQVGEIESMDTAVVDAEADAGTLGDIQEVMADSVESGEGLTEEAAQIAEVAVESIRARLGMKRDQKVMPAMESFGSKSSRLTATKIAMEGVMDTVKKIWENIIKALKWVWEKVKSFWLSLTKNRGALLKHLEGLKKRVADMKDGEMNEKTVKGSAAKAFAINGNGTFDIAATVLNNSGKLLKGTVIGSKAAEGLVRTLTNPSGSVHEVSNASKELVGHIEKAFEGLGKVGSAGKAVEGKAVQHFGVLVGGKSVALTTGKEGEGDKETMTISLQLEDNSKSIGDEAATLNKAQMGQLTDLAIEVVKELQAVDAAQKDMDKITKACEAVAQAVIKGASSGAGEANKENAEVLKAAAANIRSLNSLVAKFGSSLPTAAFQAAKAGGDYVVASLAAHGAKKEEKKEEKK